MSNLFHDSGRPPVIEHSAGQLSPEEKAEYLRLIKADIAQAQAHLNDLPQADRRGLSLDTLRHFGCGYIPNWVLTLCRAKLNCGTYLDDNGNTKHLPPPSPRIIIPTSGGYHFNAVATPTARQNIDKRFWKQHAGSMELFYDNAALDSDLICILEGEFDAMSIYQATRGKVAAVAILGCGNWKKTLLPLLPKLQGKRLLVLLDADDAGVKATKKLIDELVQRGCIAVSRSLYSALSQKEKANDFDKKVDANRILLHGGDSFLNTLIEKVIRDADFDFQKLEDTLAEENRLRQELADLPDAQFTPTFKDKANSSQVADNAFHAPVSPDLDIWRATKMLEVIPASDLSYDEWISIGMALKNNGNPVADWANWSRNDSRFKAGECERLWQGFNRDGYNIGTIYEFAIKYGYDAKSVFKLWCDMHPDFNQDNSTPNVSTDDKTAADISDWEAFNGKINPAFLPKLINAKNYLDSFTSLNITPADALSSKTKHALALCKFYDCFAAYVDKFFATLLAAKKKAFDAIKLMHDEGGDFVAEPPAELLALSKVSVRDIKAEVPQLITKYKKAHKNWCLSELQRKNREAAQRKQVARNEKFQADFERLNELYSLPASPNRDAEIIDTIKGMCDWKRDKHGNPVEVKSTAANLKLIFSYDPNLRGLFGLDEFQDAPVFLKKAPWRKQPCIKAEWTDRDDSELRVYLRETYPELAGKDLIFDYFTSYANMNSFHAVKEMFNSLPQWDGVPRAEELFIKFLKVEDTPFARAVTMKWLLAAIARIYHPGCRFQNALVLHGDQGIGKSYTLEQLGGPYYAAITDRVDDSHAADTIKLVWIGEFKEMAGMRKADVNAIKQFIELSTDTRRFAYARRARSIPRHCVFAITVNDEKFLSDQTGNRRYWVLHCKCPAGQYISGLSHDYIQQLWAEVYFKYNELFKDGFDEKQLELSREMRLQAEEIAKQYTTDDGMEGEIAEFINGRKIPHPAIWNWLNREERAEFGRTGCVKLVDGYHDLNCRIRARGGRDVDKSINELYRVLHSKDNGIVVHSIMRGGERVDELWIYGTEERQHICAAEIYNECFGNDRRKTMHRISEVLAKLDGWQCVKKKHRDNVYGEQINIYYRTAA